MNIKAEGQMKDRTKDYIMLHLILKYNIKCLEWYDIIKLLYAKPVIFESVIKMLDKMKVLRINDTKVEKWTAVQFLVSLWVKHQVTHKTSNLSQI